MNIERVKEIIQHMDSDIRMRVMSDHEKKYMREIQDILRESVEKEELIPIDNASVEGLKNPVEHCQYLQEEIKYLKHQNKVELKNTIDFLELRVRQLSAWIVHNY